MRGSGLGCGRGRALVMAIAVVAAAGCSGGQSPVRPVDLPPTTIPVEEPPTAEVLLSDDGGPIVVPPGGDLAAAVDTAPPGTHFILRPGIHRGHEVVPKDGMTFSGEAGAVMTGAIVLEGFEAAGTTWQLAGMEPTARDHGRCIDGYEACARTHDLFIDDVMLWQVGDASDLVPGTWLWDGDVIQIADDPDGRTIELSVLPYAFVGSADDVTIENLAVVKYATPAQEGAIAAQEPGEGERGLRWRIDGVEITGAHGAGIRAGDDTLIIDSHIHGNGQLGVTGAGGTGLVIESSEISGNNIAGFAWEWEAGGVKVTNSFDVTFRENVVRGNLGPGLWCDLDTVRVEYVGNLVTGNGGPGIFHEICGVALIHDNVVEDNGFDKTDWMWGAGILVAASNDTEVTRNVIRGNVNAISGIQQDRGEGTFGLRLLENLWVHDNTITLGSGSVGIVEDVGDHDVFTERDNRFEGNTYVGEDGRAYRWGNRALSRSAWIGHGQDIDGVWLDEERSP